MGDARSIPPAPGSPTFNHLGLPKSIMAALRNRGGQTFLLTPSARNGKWWNAAPPQFAPFSRQTGRFENQIG